MKGFWKKMWDDETGSARSTPEDRDYGRIVDATVGMAALRSTQKLAKKAGLDVVNLCWEDTGRYKGSAGGPNISDLTIQVANTDPATGAARLSCMPIFRFPNFSDKTADVSIDDLFVRVGNERGKPLKKIGLRDYLSDLRRYLSEPSSWGGLEESLLAPREKEVLVSAQACFLPVPRSGKATFNPVLFNYQSSHGAPAVLAIVATREGTSATIIDNTRDAFSEGFAWGQRLFFNGEGERASFTGTRLSDFVAAGGDKTDSTTSVTEAKHRNLNCVLLIQVPLHLPPSRHSAFDMAPPMCSKSEATGGPMRSRSDVEEAVIGHGEMEGPFTEVDGLSIRRDARFPIRVIVQFYKATESGVVDPKDVQEIAEQIEGIYANAKAVGSLVLDPDEGRSTEWDDQGRGKIEPKDFWEQFWKKQEAMTGRNRHLLMRELEILLGRRPGVMELEEAIRRVFREGS